MERTKKTKEWIAWNSSRESSSAVPAVVQGHEHAGHGHTESDHNALPDGQDGGQVRRRDNSSAAAASTAAEHGADDRGGGEHGCEHGYDAVKGRLPAAPEHAVPRAPAAKPKHTSASTSANAPVASSWRQL